MAQEQERQEVTLGEYLFKKLGGRVERANLLEQVESSDYFLDQFYEVRERLQGITADFLRIFGKTTTSVDESITYFNQGVDKVVIEGAISAYLRQRGLRSIDNVVGAFRGNNEVATLTVIRNQDDSYFIRLTRTRYCDRKDITRH